MIRISLPRTGDSYGEQGRALVFYLAMEEYVADRLDVLLAAAVPEGRQREAFFIWQVPPTVIFGRNQVMEAEVNLPYCREKGVRLFRRKSGGGCVYADMGNIMMSYVTDSTEVAFTFDRFLQRVVLMLRRAGLDAARSGRNDVLVGGRKVSGNAFFLRPDRSIVHGTMLFDSDFAELERTITPSDAKVHSKGVSSVRQHVANVRDLLPEDSPLRDIARFRKYMLDSFCDGEVFLGEDDIAEIERIEASYLEPSFLEGRNHRYSLERSGRIEGVGEIAVTFGMTGGEIVDVSLSGDFFVVEEGIEKLLTERLAGCGYDRSAIAAALDGADTERYVLGLTAERFLTLIN